MTLLLWINANSGFEYGGAPPSVLQTDADNLVYMILGEVLVVSEAARRGIQGLYDIKSRTIWLRDDFDPEDKQHLSYLVHELVHFLQHQKAARSRSGCGPELEAQAYAIQNRFLLEHGLPATRSHIHKYAGSGGPCADGR